MADIRVIGTVLVAPTLRLIGGWDAEDLRLGGILTVWRTFTHNVRAVAQCLLPACLVNSTRIEDAGTFKHRDKAVDSEAHLSSGFPTRSSHSL